MLCETKTQCEINEHNNKNFVNFISMTTMFYTPTTFHFEGIFLTDSDNENSSATETVANGGSVSIFYRKYYSSSTTKEINTIS